MRPLAVALLLALAFAVAPEPTPAEKQQQDDAARSFAGAVCLLSLACCGLCNATRPCNEFRRPATNSRRGAVAGYFTRLKVCMPVCLSVNCSGRSTPSSL
jgi:hypothetical protein